MSKVTKLSMQLPCQYTDVELAEKRDALADVIMAIGKTEERKSSAAKAFKEELDGLYASSICFCYSPKARALRDS